MIMHSIIAANNVIKYNNELSTWVNKICNEIEKNAHAGKYIYYAVINSRYHDMNKDVAVFLNNELGYRVYLNDSNVIEISWRDYAIEDVQRNDYLTAITACRIADNISQSYDNICAKINEYIEICSNSGKSYCVYSVGNLCSAVLEEVEETLRDAGYNVVFNDNKLIIKWD